MDMVSVNEWRMGIALTGGDGKLEAHAWLPETVGVRQLLGTLFFKNVNLKAFQFLLVTPGTTLP